jgi:hypothetical protein
MPRVSIENIKDLDPMAGYAMSSVDWSADDYWYTGYENSEGQWFICRISFVGLPVFAFEYAKGNTQYAKGWLHRDEPTYKYYDEVF